MGLHYVERRGGAGLHVVAADLPAFDGLGAGIHPVLTVLQASVRLWLTEVLEQAVSPTCRRQPPKMRARTFMGIAGEIKITGLTETWEADSSFAGGGELV